MPGIKGMIQAVPPANALRSKIWQSMRILRRFTVPELCRTSGAKRSNARKFLQGLMRHGYVEPFGPYISGRPGLYQSYRLLKDTGPFYPVRCNICGRALRKPCDKENSDE